MQPQVARVLEAARRTVVEQPMSSESWGNYGCLLDAHELAEPAAVCYRRAWELDPGASRWAYLLGTVLEGFDLPVDEILEPFAAAANANPGFAPLHHRMGDVLSSRGRLQEARQAYERALAIDDTLTITHRSLGQLLLRIGEPEEARRHLQRADSLLTDDRSINASLALASRRLGLDAESESCSAKARLCEERVALPDSIKFEVRQKNISLENCRLRALDAASRGDAARGLEQLAPCREVQTDDPYFHFLLGQTLVQLGRHDLAIAQLERTLSLNAEFPGAAFMLATSLLTQGRAADAEAPLRMTLALKPDHGSAHALLGTVLTRTGRPADALVEFQRADELQTLNDVAEFDWANALAQTGAMEQAIVHYRRTIQFNDRHADAHFNMGVMLERLGRTPEAIACFEAAMTIDPDHRARQRLANIVDANSSNQSSSPP
jgi:tetratricopeptide (TPR) repeat protein